MDIAGENPIRNKFWADLRLYLVTDFELPLKMGRSESAVAGGVTVVQFRDKTRSSRELYQVGQAIRDFCALAGVAFIMNDRLDLAVTLVTNQPHAA